MAGQRTITKALGGVEDLLHGKGTVQQERAGQIYTITKNRNLRIVDSYAELLTLDPDKFPEVGIVQGDNIILVQYNGTAYEALDSNNLVYPTFAELGSGLTPDVAALLRAKKLKVKTTVNNLTSNSGGADYYILTTAEKDAAGYTEGYVCKQIGSTGYWTCLAFDTSIVVESVGAIGDNITDDMGAFQAASYLIRKAGRPIKLLFNSAHYYISEYKSALDDDFLYPSNGGTVSKIWQIPTKCELDFNNAKIRINGGSSSGFGYSTSANILAFPNQESSTDVTSVVNATKTVTVTSTVGLSVGKRVILSRQGGQTAGIPNTPSQERAPMQFVTIKSINSLDVEFEESFIHDFEAVTDLVYLTWPQNGTDYTQDISIKNVEFVSAGNDPYILISRTYNIMLDNVKFDNIAYSIASSQKLRIGSMESVVTDNTTEGTIESVSDIVINSFNGYGNGSTNSLGALFFSDNCRLLKLGKITISDYEKTGLAMFYSVDGVIDNLTLLECGTTADFDTFHGAFSCGMPAKGNYGSREVAEADLFKCRNHSGNSRLIISKLTIKGDSVSIPVRFHDIGLVVKDAEIDGFNNASGSVSPFFGGRSGSRRSDPTYYPNGGETTLQVDNLTVNGVDRTNVVSLLNGYNGLFKEGSTFTAGAATATATSFTVDDGSKIKSGAAIFFIPDGVTGVNPTAASVTSISGNVVNFTPALLSDLPDNSPVWSISVPVPLSNEDVFIKHIKYNGETRPSIISDTQLYPDFQTGAGPYTANVDLQMPSEGSYILEVSCTSNDSAHYEKARYYCRFDTSNGAFPIYAISEQKLEKMRTNATINSATISSSGVVTVVAGSATIGKSAFISYKWLI